MTTATPLAAARADDDTALPTSGLLLLAGLAAGAVAQGGFYGRGQLLLGGAVLAAVAAGRGWSGRPQPTTWAGLALAAWCVAAAAMTGQGLAAGARTAALPVAVVAVAQLVGLWDDDRRRSFLDALLGLGALLAALGLVAVVAHQPPWAHLDQGLWRASTTLTYENATGGLLAMLALVALARPRDRRHQVAAGLLVAGTAATLSRGAGLALAAGLVVLAARRHLAWRPLVGGLVLAAGTLPSATGPTSWPALAAGTAGLAIVLLAPHRVALAVLVLGCLVVPVVVTGAALPHRLSVSSPDRSGETRGAWHDVSAHPLVGIGPGDQALRFDDARGAHLDGYAHDEYLQVLWKSGLVGLVLLLALLALLARGAWRGRRPDPAWSGCVAGLVALGVASGLDFLWHLPLIPLVGAVLAGVARPPFHTTQESS